MFTSIYTLLNQQQPEYELNTTAAFRQLEVAATVDPLHLTTPLPILTLQLQSNVEMFTCFLQPLPGKDAYAGMDIMAAARQIPALKEVEFTRLHISYTASPVLHEDRQLQIECKVA